ncbi:LPXTG cell wall anchor domain-containing protein, partial [Enterococcus villorum]
NNGSDSSGGPDAVIPTNTSGGSGMNTPKLPSSYGSSYSGTKPMNYQAGTTPKMYPKTDDTLNVSASWLGGLISLISGLGIWKLRKNKKNN